MSTTPFLEETARRRAEVGRGMFLAGLPRTLTAEEASIEFDFDTPLEEGWSLKLTRDETVEEGFGYSFIDPEGWELFPDDTRISPTGERYSDIVFNEAGEAIDYTVTTPEGETFTLAELTAVPAEPIPPAEPVVPLEVEPILTEDYALIYANYQRTGGTLGIEDWIRAGTPLIPVQEVSIESLITDVFPDMTPEGFAEFIEEDWEGFTESISAGGRTQKKDALLRQMGYSLKEIDAFYAEPEPLKISPEGIEQTVNPPSLPAGYGQPAKIRIMPDFEFVGTELQLRSDDFLIFHEGKKVGIIKADTGDFVMDDPGFWWKAWIPSLQDRLFLSQTGQVPAEAFSGTPLKVQQQISLWLYAPKKIGETAIPSPATILSFIGLIGTIGFGVYTLGTGAWRQFHLMWQSRTVDKTAKALDVAWKKSATSTIFAPNTTQYKDAEGIWKLYNSPVPKGETASTFQQAAINALKQTIASDVVFREGIANYLKGVAPTPPTGAPIQPFFAIPPTVPTPAPTVPVGLIPAVTGLSPSATQAISSIADKIATGALAVTQITPEFLIGQVPTLVKTPSLIIQLTELGHTEVAITAMAPEEAWANLFKAPVAEVAPPAIPPEVAVPPEVPTVPEVRTAEEFIKSRLVEGVRGFAPSEVQETLATFSHIVKPDITPTFTFKDTKGNNITVYEKEDEILAFHNDQAVAKIGFPRPEGFGISVVQEYGNQGIGTGILGYFLDKYPNRQTTGFTRAGEALMRKLFQERQVVKPPAVEVAKPPVVHRGTEPEGIAIADELGLRYDGIQEELGMQFTDVAETGTTFYARTVEEARTSLADIRAKFAKAPLEEIVDVKKPLKSLPEPTPEQVSTNLETTGTPTITPAQVERTLTKFSKYVLDPTTQNAFELTRELRREARSKRVENLKARSQELIVTKGIGAEEAMNQAISETMAGELPLVRSDYLDKLSQGMRDALFDKVYQTLKDEPFEMMSTTEALTNALLGKPIPREPGIKGGSAYKRLIRVFSPDTFAAIEKGSKEGKTLRQVIEATYEIVGNPPIPVDKKTADYLRSIPSRPISQARLGEEVFVPTGLSDPKTIRQIEQETLALRIELAEEPTPPIRNEPPIEKAIDQMPLFPRPTSDMVIKVLKEIGWSPVDIGNFLRANKASFDFSFWRQQAPLIASHPITFTQANIEAWKALWSQKSAEASWAKITGDPLYQIYEVAVEAGGDFLRPLILPKGTSQWRGTEEFGYITGERLIPRLTGKLPWVKLSARAFETGTNVHNWLIFKNYYKAMLKLNEMYASGEKTLKPGEAFNIQKEMVDFSKMLANFSARGSLGKFQATAPVLSGFFFAARAGIGRVLSVKDLLNANPRVRSEAWKNAALFVSTLGGIILLGAAMGWWEVEKDPRSAEYMSIRIGTTRIDPWGGFRQFLVFFTRAITGTGVSSVTGAEYKADPLNLIQTFIRGKASPLASLILDFWRGKNFIGEEVDVKNKRQWAERIAPFAVWDIYEAYIDDPSIGLGIVIPAVVGAGVQTYTGDWRENFPKLGLPKYSDNLPYGITEPYYDTADFWTDTSPQFAGVDPSTLTEAKGFPSYIREIAEARIVKEHLATLPNQKLVSLNADETKGTTFAVYYQQWIDREAIVASGDEEKLKEFDQDDRTKNAHLGNFSQRQFALLNKYWAITNKKEQAEFLEEHEDEIGVNPRQDWLRSHPKENAQLAVWGQAKIFSLESYEETQRLLKELDIPDNAIPEFTLPPEGSVENYFEREQAVEDYGAMSAEALLVLTRDEELLEWYGFDQPEQPERYYELKVKNRAEREYWDTLKDKDSPTYIEDEDERRVEFYKEFPDSEYFDDERRTEAIANDFTDDQIEAWVERGRLVDKYSSGSPTVKEWAFDNPQAYKKALEEKMLEDKGGLPEEERGHYEEWVEPAIRIQADETFIKEDAYWDELGDRDKPQTYIEDEAKRKTAFFERFPDSKYFDSLERIEAYKAGFTEREANLWADRGRTIGKFEAGSSEALVWLLDHWDVYEKAIDAGLLEDRKAELLEREPILRINVEFATNDDWYNDGIPDKHKGIENRTERDATIARERAEYLAGNPEYNRARYQRDAFGLKDKDFKPFPDELVETYVDYYVLPKKPDDWLEGVAYYEDEWFLQDNPEFHQALVDFGIFKELKDVSESKVPTREIFEKWWIYNTFTTQYDRDAYRLENPDLDEWGVNVAKPPKWTRTMSEQRRRARITPSERFLEDVAEASQSLKDIMAALGEELR